MSASNTHRGLPPGKLRAETIKVGALAMYSDEMGSDAQGKGRPLVLLHPGFGTIASAFGKLRPELAKHRLTVGIEQQAHGHTADIDRPLSYEQMVEDTAALLVKLNIRDADIFGWSDGGILALGLAAKHSGLVHRVAIIGAGYNPDAEGPGFADKLDALKPDDPKMADFRKAYEEVAPDPKNFVGMMQKVKDMYRRWKGWSRAEMKSLKAPLMVMLGDRDLTRIEHAVELYRLVPDGRLAVLPKADHGAPVTRSDWVIAMLNDFFNEKDGKKG